MKTPEELNTLKAEAELLNQEIEEMSEDKQEHINAGCALFPIMPQPETPYTLPEGDTYFCVNCGYMIYDITPTTYLPNLCPCCGSTAGWEPV